MEPWEIFRKIIEDIEECEPRDEDFLELKRDLRNAAVNYARLRVQWFLADQDEKREYETTRVVSHNRLIDACNILSRYMESRGIGNS